MEKTDSLDNANRLAGKQPMELSLVSSKIRTPPPSGSHSATAPRAKRGKALIISEASLRRSTRIHNNTKGFESPGCKHKDCLGSSSNPPTISSTVVRDLGATFCKLDPSSLTEEKLNAKPLKKKHVSKPNAKKARKEGADPKSKKDGNSDGHYANGSGGDGPSSSSIRSRLVSSFWS